MRIIGPEDLVFGVDNVDACRAFLRDYGLTEIALDGAGHRFEALDGTALTIRHQDDAALPAPLPTATKLRQTVWGCEDQATVDAIAGELSKDRQVTRNADGSIATVDDVGFELVFRVTTRRPIDLVPERVNSPGAAAGRQPTAVGVDYTADPRPRTLSHVVYFTPDMAKMERFYVDRLKFVVTDRFNNAGPFLRPQANDDHHCLFFIDTPPHMQGLEHVAFHMQGPTEMMLAGTRMVNKGWESHWGPGRHQFGSNWFWYFNSPLSAHIEYDADMDKHDDDWQPRVLDGNAETSQLFLFRSTEKWYPGGPPAAH